MQILNNDEKFKDYQTMKRRRKILSVVNAVLSVLMVFVCGVLAMASWTEIQAFFQEETPHVHQWKTSLQKVSTCTDDGLNLRYCQLCHEEEKTFISAIGHNLVDNACVDCGKTASVGLEYKLCVDDEGEGYVKIQGLGTCLDRDLVIPNRMGGFPVQEIAKNAFKGNENIRSVAIHDGVKKIGAGAFANCKNLYTILLPAGLDENAFFGVFHNTAYTNDINNWYDNALYRQGYLLDSVEETTNV